MAIFNPAVELTLQNEGGFFHNLLTGEIVNHGITLDFVRDCGYCETADEQYIKNLSTDQAVEIYQKYFWDRYHIGNIADQALANKVFDLTVNMGPGNASHEGALTLLQRAVIDCGGLCAVDGQLGPITIHQINSLDPAELLAAYRRRAKTRYVAIAASNPKHAGDLAGWLERLAS